MFITKPPFIEPYAPVLYTPKEFKIKMEEVQNHPLFLYFNNDFFSQRNARPHHLYDVFDRVESEIRATRWYFLPSGLYEENQSKVSEEGKQLALEVYRKILRPLSDKKSTTDFKLNSEVNFKFLILRLFFLQPWDEYLEQNKMDRFNYDLFKAYANVTELYAPYYWKWD